MGHRQAVVMVTEILRSSAPPLFSCLLPPCGAGWDSYVPMICSSLARAASHCAIRACLAQQPPPSSVCMPHAYMICSSMPPRERHEGRPKCGFSASPGHPFGMSEARSIRPILPPSHIGEAVTAVSPSRYPNFLSCFSLLAFYGTEDVVGGLLLSLALVLVSQRRVGLARQAIGAGRMEGGQDRHYSTRHPLSPQQLSHCTVEKTGKPLLRFLCLFLTHYLVGQGYGWPATMMQGPQTSTNDHSQARSIQASFQSSLCSGVVLLQDRCCDVVGYIRGATNTEITIGIGVNRTPNQQTARH